jgi:phosphoglycolate phosphatase-like HAD superfamily hydrolase
MQLILWDIDGTLVRSRGARVSLGAFVAALHQACQLEPGRMVYPHDVGGKTDPQIALEMLLEHLADSAAAEALLDGFASTYYARLAEQRAALAADLRVLPGVPAILERLRQLGVCQSLLTGNLEPVARLKLALVDLDGYFAFELGAFGSDHRDRTCLVPITRARVRAATGHEPESIVVIGDTPRDIACARAGGARVVAVATGTYSRAELEAHQPDALLDDLQDTQAVIEALLQDDHQPAASV